MIDDDTHFRDRRPPPTARFKSARHARLGLVYPSETASTDELDAPPRYDADARVQLRWLKGALVVIVLVILAPLFIAPLV
jgi:hypothetical protein